MEFTSLSKKQRVLGIFEQIQTAICQLKQWNADVTKADDYYFSPNGMQKLAASCMLIEAIGEGIKRVDERTHQQLLPLRPEIPWKAVKGMRDHIAHGYFDINTDLVWDVVKNDLSALRDAIDYFIDNLYEIVEVE